MQYTIKLYKNGELVGGKTGDGSERQINKIMKKFSNGKIDYDTMTLKETWKEDNKKMIMEVSISFKEVKQ